MSGATRERGHHPASDLHDKVGNRATLARMRYAKIARDEQEVAGDAARRASRAARDVLPHRREAERILRTDLSAVRAAIGPEATAACDALGAEAFAVGNLAVFGRDPDVATVVHEAAHALQQRDAAGGALPSRLPILHHDTTAEREARGREAGTTGALTRSRLAVALKPKVGDAAKAPGGTDLLPAPGASTRLAYLAPGTEVAVIGTVGPAYRVTVTSGEHAGKTGIVPGHVLVELPPTPATGGGGGGGGGVGSANAARDVKMLDDAELQRELIAARNALADKPFGGGPIDSYYRELRDEWSRRQRGTTSEAGGASDPPLGMDVDPPLVIPLGENLDKNALAATIRLALEGRSTAAPVGAEVMDAEYFGRGSWVYTYPSKTKLPIRWDLGPGPRGILAEPLITNHYYAPLNPEVLPRSFPGADISFGGTYTPIEGHARLRDASGAMVWTPWVGFEITQPGLVQYKTVDNLEKYNKPGELEKGMMKYLEKLLADELEYTSTDRGPGEPRIRIRTKDPAQRIYHIELRDLPTEQHANELAEFRELAARSGVTVVIFGPAGVHGKSTVIDQHDNPAPAYIPPAGQAQAAIDPVLDRQNARGNALQAGAEAAFGLLNEWGASIQKADEQAAYNRAVQEVEAHLATNPETGASIWITWYGNDAPWFSLNKPSGTFGGIAITYERMPSESPPVGAYEAKERSMRRVWIPPRAALSATPANTHAVKSSLGQTMGRIVYLQKLVDEYAGEDFLVRRLHGRADSQRFSGHEMDDARWYHAQAKAALERGDLAEAEAQLAKAAKALADVEMQMKLYLLG